MDKLSQSFSEFSHKHPLVPITTIFIVGIITTSYQWLKDEITSPLLMISMLILIAAISKRWRFNFILMYFTFFLLGAALSDTMLNPKLSHSHIKSFVEQSNLINKDDSIGMRIEGVLYRAPERFPDKVRLYLNAEMIFLNSRSSHFYKEMVIPSLIKDFGDKVTGKILLTVGSESVSQFETISSEEPEMRIQGLVWVIQYITHSRASSYPEGGCTKRPYIGVIASDQRGGLSSDQGYLVTLITLSGFGSCGKLRMSVVLH